ncbi:Dihydroorotate dehydrogenase (quinone), mitochondrial [Strongyloides ratti]|uniref:Dihydroorotate dehydrogenase (quinone), mitochondrial n=1 Tax=Strongyloides ratti TaxID=34506 RepID=A0A090L2A2_STRRB|nr:Dihydroorotate dehydrogenase (quinone), mitochondrial [Strongyloides ratti]CEF63817.1 Dihydroorotate dehydrogenase (quinone), mitochondrial [Strongyloides ratti]
MYRSHTPRQQIVKFIREGMIPIFVGGGIAFVGIQLVSGSEKFYKEVVMPLTHKYLDGEKAHRLAVIACKYGLYPRCGQNLKEYDNLKTNVFGKEFNNPLGIAAGFDKNGEAIKGMKNMGWGFIEIGSVTPQQQEGNPKPRVFRLIEDRGIINRYGFNSDGLDAVLKRVKEAFNFKNQVPLGINLGKNKHQTDAKVDYQLGMLAFSKYADYIVINISSPNTPGLRSLQSKDELIKIITAVNEKRCQDNDKETKLLLKVAPDLTTEDKRDIANVITDKKYKIDGVIVSNTTICRNFSLESEFKNETGGLSGAPLKDLSTKCIKEMYQLTKGSIPIIGSGGIENGKDAYEKIKAGASLVQIYSAMVYQGFPVIGKIKRELSELIEKDGFKSLSEVIGIDNVIDNKCNIKKNWWFW